MPVETLVRNPFMMMLDPELVVAAMEASERLKQLNRHECRPLDRVAAPAADGNPVGEEADEE